MNRDTAFPIIKTNDTWIDESGLTKRELFAALALQGRLSLVVNPDLYRMAELCVEAADALIAALERK